MNNKIYKSTEELAPFIEEMTKVGKSVKLTVIGSSMEPLLINGRDIVEIKKAPVYRKYDTILYMRKTGTMVLHRIVKKKDGIYYLCGDNQTMIEYPIYEEQIIGKVINYTRKGKTLKADGFISMLYARIWCLNVNFRKPLYGIAIKIRRMFK